MKRAEKKQSPSGIGEQTLADLVQSIRAAERLSTDQAAAVWRGLADVAQALRKAGHPKRERLASVPAAQSGQGDLLAEAAAPDRAPAGLLSAPTGV